MCSYSQVRYKPLFVQVVLFNKHVACIFPSLLKHPISILRSFLTSIFEGGSDIRYPTSILFWGGGGSDIRYLRHPFLPGFRYSGNVRRPPYTKGNIDKSFTDEKQSSRLVFQVERRCKVSKSVGSIDKRQRSPETCPMIQHDIDSWRHAHLYPYPSTLVSKAFAPYPPLCLICLVHAPYPRFSPTTALCTKIVGLPMRCSGRSCASSRHSALYQGKLCGGGGGFIAIVPIYLYIPCFNNSCLCLSCSLQLTITYWKYKVPAP